MHVSSTITSAFCCWQEPHSNGPLFVEMNFYIRVAKPDLSMYINNFLDFILL